MDRTRQTVIEKYTKGLVKSLNYAAGSTPPIPGLGVSPAASVPSISGLSGLSSMPSIPGLPSLPSFSLPSFGSTSISNVSFTGQGEGQTPNYFLQVLFYLFLYLFVMFVVAVFIHFSITPVFSFTPGGKGFLSVPGSGSDIVYWNTRKQPDPTIAVPSPTDPLASYPFINSFSLCFDVLVTNMTAATKSTNRLVLYKVNATQPPAAPPSEMAMPDYMNTTVGASMIAYLANDTNDFVITFFSMDSTGRPVQYSCAPVKNIPIDTPFRISLVAEVNSFTVYLNAMQVSQKIIPGGIQLNPVNTSPGAQRFYAAPSWASLPRQSVYVQNFHLWPHAITYPEVQAAQPSLAAATDFTGKKAT